MKAAFPHLDSMHIFLQAIEETTGNLYILPSETSRKTLTLCLLHSDEYGLRVGPLRTRFRGFDLNVFRPALTADGSFKSDI
jgi:hypothetical protein